MFIKRYLFMFTVGVIPPVAYNFSVASPADGIINDGFSVQIMKVEKQQYNPWARRRPPQMGVNRYFLPRHPINRGSRFVTEEELDALNNKSAITGESNVSRSAKPLPMTGDLKQKPEVGKKQYSRAYDRPYSHRFYDSSRQRFTPDYYRWGNNPAVLAVDPMFIDPMDPGRYGLPFSGPFKGIDSFIYE